jgi:Tat protein translocase TatB subunit
MSLGPEKIILILVVALIVFGPQRLPEIARQVGAMLHELRRMQDSVRGELEQVLHPDFQPPDAGPADAGVHSDGGAVSANGASSHFDTDHLALPPGSFASDMSHPDATPTSTTGELPTDDVTDDGFAGPRSFS